MGNLLTAIEVRVEGPPEAEEQIKGASRFDADELDMLRRAFDMGGDNGLSRDHFDKAFSESLPTLAIERLFAAAAGPKGRVAAFPDLVDAVARLCKPAPAARSVKALNRGRLGVLFDLFKAEDAEPSVECLATDDLHDEAEAGVKGALTQPHLLMLMASAMRQCSDEPLRVELLEPVARDALLLGPLSRPSWVRWAASCMPRLGDVLELLVMNGMAALAGDDHLPRRVSRLAAERWLPALVVGSSSEGESQLLTPVLRWAVSLTVPQPEGAPTTAWRRLYSSVDDGLSLNRFSHSVVGYDGATLLVVREAAGRAGAEGAPAPCTWAVYVDTPWKSVPEGRYFAHEACAVYTLEPLYHGHPATGRARNFATFTPHVRAILGAGRGDHSDGEDVVGFGGGNGAFRCALTDGLTMSLYRHNDDTYEDDVERLTKAGVPLKDHALRTSIVEVWGLGGARADEALNRVHDQAARARARAGKVNRRAFGETWSDTPDKMLMELGGRTFYSDTLGPARNGPRDGNGHVTEGTTTPIQ